MMETDRTGKDGYIRLRLIGDAFSVRYAAVFSSYINKNQAIIYATTQAGVSLQQSSKRE